MTHKSQKAYFPRDSFKEINKLNINKTNTKNLSLNFCSWNITDKDL